MRRYSAKKSHLHLLPKTNSSYKPISETMREQFAVKYFIEYINLSIMQYVTNTMGYIVNRVNDLRFRWLLSRIENKLNALVNLKAENLSK